MYRVRLSAGQEASYQTAADLVRAIKAGLVTSEAQIREPATGKWCPLDDFHKFRDALAEYASSHPEAASSDIPAPATIPVAVPHRSDGTPTVPVTLYQMHSYSARELEAKRQTRWVFPALIGALSVVLIFALLWDASPVPGRAEEGVELGLLPRRATRTQPALAVVPASPNPQFTPEALAERCLGARARGAFVLDSSAREAGLSDLSAASRLTDPDSARYTLTALAMFALLVHQYRVEQLGRERAYRDTARSLVATRRWTSVDFAEWRARTVRRDPQGLAKNQADSLLAALEDVYTALRNAAGTYRYEGGAIQFARPEAAGAYNDARDRAERLRLRSDIELEAPAPPALQVLSNSIGGALPPGR